MTQSGKFYILAVLLLLLCNIRQADAAFVIKKVNITTESASAKDNLLSKVHVEAAASSTDRNSGRGDSPKKRVAPDNDGWEGTTAMWCAIGSIFVFPALICAIVFGAMGLKKGKKHRGRAIAGLAISLNLIFLLALAIAFA